MQENKVAMVIGFIKMSILIIILTIILVMMIYYAREQINLIESYKESLPDIESLSNYYELLKPNKFINLTECDKTMEVV